MAAGQKRVKTITFTYCNSNTDTEEIKARTDIVALISETVHLARKGNTWWGLCPFHAEKTPSFSVSPDRQRFRCWGCQAGGDVIDFIRLRDGVDFRGARDYLAARAGLSMEASPEDRRAIQKAREKREADKRQQELAQKIIRDEWERMIEVEKWAHLFLKHVRTPRDMARPGPVWAAHTLSRVEAVLNDLERTDASERYRIARAVRGWRP